ncbi:MAG TPA: (2Fe-2S)-binding protein [Burkholderiaceae bacterium]|nr:(2Fe-2S)-binding protein [Burkholderiaceae bacterium]
MYICVCTAVTERDIAVSIEAGASSFEEVQFATGLGTCCGQCSEYAREHVEQACTEFCANDVARGAEVREMEVRTVSRRGPLVPLMPLQQAA